MFEKEARKWVKTKGTDAITCLKEKIGWDDVCEQAFKDGAESTLRKIIKYFSTIVLDENCGGYFSYLLENEEKIQELAKELENV